MALYASGTFTTAGGIAARGAVGSGVNSYVHCLAVHDDGSGPAL